MCSLYISTKYVHAVFLNDIKFYLDILILARFHYVRPALIVVIKLWYISSCS